MHSRFRALPIVLAGVLAALAFAGDDLELHERLGRIAASAADDIDGLTVLVAVGSDELLADGYGVSDPAADEPAGPDGLYRVGALMPSLVTLAILQLTEEGAVDLDAPVAELTGIEGLDARVRLRELLAHTSGLPAAETFLATVGGEGGDVTRERFVAWLVAEPLASDPGACFAFDATNVLLAGWILEDARGRPVDAVLEESLFEPLGLENTCFRADGPPRGDVWEAHVEVAGELVECGFALEAFAARDLCSSARDLARLLRGILDRQIVTDRGFDVFSTPVFLADGTESPAASGCYAAAVGDHTSLALGGGTGGARFHLAWYPSFDLTIVTLGLGRHAPVDQIERRLARAVFELPEPGVQDLPLPPEAHTAYRGGYYVACTRIAIEVGGEHLTAVWPSGRTLELLYQDYQVFVARSDPEIRLTFLFEDDREQAIAFTLEEHGTRTVAKRID